MIDEIEIPDKIYKLLIYHRRKLGWLNVVNKAVYSENNYKFVFNKINNLDFYRFTNHNIYKEQADAVKSWLLTFTKPTELFEVVKLWSNLSLDLPQSKTPITKDNSKWGLKLGSSGNHEFAPNIRIPSRKRSIQTWKNFYNLFPQYQPSKDNFKIPVIKTHNQ